VNPYYDDVPADSYIAQYLRYMATQETAHAYDFWCALWSIACACGRNTVVARPRAPVYLNMYLILVGDSGKPRKTTSVNTALSLVRDLYDGDNAIGFVDSRVTPEHLDLIIHERSKEHGAGKVIIGVPELAVFMGSETYTAGMPPTLTDLYDCPDHRQGGTISRGLSEQRNVWISMLSASTPIWLLKTVNPRVIEGGFSSRCMFVVNNDPKQSIPWPDEQENGNERALLLDGLHDILARSREHHSIRIVDTALSKFRTWYEERERSADPYKQSFEAREDAHVLRIAALLCINDGSWLIHPHHIAFAIKLIASVKMASGAMFEHGVMRTKYAAAYDVIRTALIEAGMDPVPKHVLTRKCRYWLHVSEFQILTEVMHECHALQRFLSHEGMRGRPAEYFRGTDRLLQNGVAEQVLNRFT